MAVHRPLTDRRGRAQLTVGKPRAVQFSRRSGRRGGRPVQIFKDLSAMQAKWSDINISLVDDRVVDTNHDDSNEKLVNNVLIKDEAKDANFISLCNQYKDLLNLKRPFGIMLLGMGEDGHFASLFPKLIETNPEYFDLESDPEIFFTEPMGNPCHRRVSMNLSMILESKDIFFNLKNIVGPVFV